MTPLGHIILFKLFATADPEEVLSRLRSAERGGDPRVTRVERSLDERKGEGSCRSSHFDSREALDAFWVAPAHVEVAQLLSQNADWLVADHLE